MALAIQKHPSLRDGTQDHVCSAALLRQFRLNPSHLGEIDVVGSHEAVILQIAADAESPRELYCPKQQQNSRPLADPTTTRHPSRL